MINLNRIISCCVSIYWCPPWCTSVIFRLLLSPGLDWWWLWTRCVQLVAGGPLRFLMFPSKSCILFQPCVSYLSQFKYKLHSPQPSQTRYITSKKYKISRSCFIQNIFKNVQQTKFCEWLSRSVRSRWWLSERRQYTINMSVIWLFLIIFQKELIKKKYSVFSPTERDEG